MALIWLIDLIVVLRTWRFGDTDASSIHLFRKKVKISDTSCCIFWINENFSFAGTGHFGDKKGQFGFYLAVEANFVHRGQVLSWILRWQSYHKKWELTTLGHLWTGDWSVLHIYQHAVLDWLRSDPRPALVANLESAQVVLKEKGQTAVVRVLAAPGGSRRDFPCERIRSRVQVMINHSSTIVPSIGG